MKLQEIVPAIADREQALKSTSKAWLQRQAEQQIARFRDSRVGKRVSKGAAAIIGYFALNKFERLIAVILLFFPLLLIWANGWSMEGKDSISAYYVISNAKWLWTFYVPLTVAAFMFIVNGVMRREIVNRVTKNASWYNIYLGVFLLGVIIFNHEDFSIAHNICAILFFVGNFIIILTVRTKRFDKTGELLFDGILVSIAILSAILFGFRIINLFILEWISFAMITAHYYILSKGAARKVSSGRANRSSVNA